MKYRPEAREGRWMGMAMALLALAMATPGPARAGGSAALEERVSTLTRQLGLDASQQAAVREVLLGQRAQVQRIWSDGSVPSATRVAATRAVGRQTADRIRALLDDEQRKRFMPPPRGDGETAVASARLEEWMGSVRNVEPRQGGTP